MQQANYLRFYIFESDPFIQINIVSLYEDYSEMILEHLSILNYKNIEQAELLFSPKLNFFLGNNGMGKTNLLDAIYYMSFCKSHSNASDSQNIKHDADMALIQGTYQNNDRKEEYLTSLKRRQKKVFKKNKKEYEKLSDHIGSLPLVLVSPSDTELILGGSDERRKLIDVVISQFNREYLHRLIKYNNALQQRNALLRSETIVDETLFSLWEDQLVNEGIHIYQTRDLFIKNISPRFQHFYNLICNSSEKVSLSYKTQLVEGDFREMLANKREKDRILGYTTIGIHKDDLDMYLGDYPIKKIGSQGQNKTYVIALKFAQFDFLLNSGNTTPILLLDDIFDKLDGLRVEEIVKLVSGKEFGQIFITDTNREHLSEMMNKISGEHKIFNVSQGNVTEIRSDL